jgi:hypothetical protein
VADRALNLQTLTEKDSTHSGAADASWVEGSAAQPVGNRSGQPNSQVGRHVNGKDSRIRHVSSLSRQVNISGFMEGTELGKFAAAREGKDFTILRNRRSAFLDGPNDKADSRGSRMDGLSCHGLDQFRHRNSAARRDWQRFVDAIRDVDSGVPRQSVTNSS